MPPVFGYEYDDDCKCDPTQYTQKILGYCDPDAEWIDCVDYGSAEVCIEDDDLYRRFLKARVYQAAKRYDYAGLTAAAQELFGATAHITSASGGVVNVALGRDLTEDEKPFTQLFARVLPIAPGIEMRFVFGTDPVFGYGTGWGDYCDGSEWLTAIDVNPYGCP